MTNEPEEIHQAEGDDEEMSEESSSDAGDDGNEKMDETGPQAFLPGENYLIVVVRSNDSFHLFCFKIKEVE